MSSLYSSIYNLVFIVKLTKKTVLNKKQNEQKKWSLFFSGKVYLQYFESLDIVQYTSDVHKQLKIAARIFLLLEVERGIEKVI